VSLEETIKETSPDAITVTEDFRFLAEASARLASSLDYNETLRNVAELLASRICEMASIFLAGDDGQIELAAWHHSDPAKRELIAGMSTRDLSPGLQSVARSSMDQGKTLLVSGLDETVLTEMGISPEKVDQYKQVGITSYLLAPLVTHGKSIGVLCCVCTDEDEKFKDSDIALVEEIARRAATAVDHARLYERTRYAEKMQRYLNEATGTLNSSLDYQTTLSNVASVLVPSMADWITVHMLDDGVPKRVTLAHTDPDKKRWAEEVSSRYPIDMGANQGLAKVLREGVAEFYPVITPDMLAASARDAEHLELIKQVEMGSSMIVPMTVRDKVIGAITFVAPEQGRYSQLDLDFAKELANRAAMAVDNAQLFRDVEQKITERTQELQAANKELEAFAYSVSHDLRAPLRSIMSASMIVMEDYGESIGEDGKAELKRSSNAAKRMSALIDDLLEYSRLGRREMNVGDVDLSALARSIGSEIDMPEGVLSVQEGMKVKGDPSLLRVLLTNHLENAWKFVKEKPEPHIWVGSEVIDGSTAYYVRDNGVGFDEQFAEKLYVPFERLHSPQDYPGTGIGLANVKRIVNRHGGKVWAQGKVNEGATFYFTLGK
jgi:signal transduction histidine kinase